MQVLDLAPPLSQATSWRIWAAATTLVVLFSSALVVGSYRYLSHTFDEPTHLASGMEWLQYHQYTRQTENPPLSRLPLAVVPFLSGMRLADPNAPGMAGALPLFYERGDYITNVTKARVGNLPLFWLVVLMTWVLSGGRGNPQVASVASCLVAMLPGIVAHSGLATTDVPFVAAFLFALWRWKALLIAPSRANAGWVGLSVGVALATKFSTIPFLPPAAAALLFTFWRAGRLHRNWRSPAVMASCTGIAVLVAAVTIWASYGFRVGTLGELPASFGGYGSMPTTGLVAAIQHVPLPAHEFWHGLLFLQAHTKAGHMAYMLGQTSTRGFWMYYPVMLLVKTPLMTLLLFVVGGTLALRSREHPEFSGYALGAVGVLLIATTSPINLGTRHVLAVYPLLCMAGTYGVARASARLRNGTTSFWVAAGLVLAFQMTAVAQAFPRQLSYTNMIASGRTDYFVSDSDFDWGQDVLAVEDYFRAHPVSALYLVPYGSALFCRHDLPPLTALPVGREVNGWIAVFERPYQLNQGIGAAVAKDICQPPSPTNRNNAPKGWLDWLHRRKPVAVIGSGVLLFHVTDAGS
ncbi:MAG TPA: glycosyltransferase family 39 protein [Tepidisphaeraceae bacterium]|nr:glycosyltransferase family 39 protein [Tepidisphaeraceae bacterium]